MIRKKTKAIPIAEVVSKAEDTLAKATAVQKVFPNALLYNDIFLDATVNQSYTNFTFIRLPREIYVQPYSEISYRVNDEEKTVIIHSSPKRMKLVSISWDWRSRQDLMKFSKLSINMKNNNFKGDIMNSCKLEILDFIRKNPKVFLDKKNLDPRLEKLLVLL